MGRPDYFLDSPFRYSLGTNSSLTDHERHQLQEFLQAPIEEIRALDIAIETLVARRRDLEEGVKEHQALMHPVRRVPNEILQQVFLAALPTNHFPPIIPTDVPLSFTQVSRTWRAVALGTPQLWESIHIVLASFRSTTEGEAPARLERVRRWLNAARNLPLSISIASEITYQPCGRVQELIRSILDYAPRTRVLILRTSDHILDMFAFHRSWPVLHKVIVDMDSKPDEEIFAGRLADDNVTFWMAPDLKSVVWRTVDDIFYYVRPPSLWKHMEEIEMSSVDPGLVTNWGYTSSTIRTMLRATQDLVMLKIRISGDEDDTGSYQDLLDTYAMFYATGDLTSPLKPVPAELTLKRLTTLDLADPWVLPSQDRHATPFLHNMTLPALTSLTYTLRPPSSFHQSRAPPPSVEQHPLVRFLRSQAHPIGITRWTITNDSICEDVFLRCLRMMPNLEQLWLKENSKVEEDRHTVAFSNWRLRPNDELLHDLSRLRVCPRLHSLRVDGGEFSVEGVHAFLEVRIGLARFSPSPSPVPVSNAGHIIDRVAFLRRLYIRNATILADSLTRDNIFNPTVEDTTLGCDGRAARCSLANDCAMLGIDVRFDAVGIPDAGNSYPTCVDDVLEAASRRVSSSFNPRFGLPQNDASDGWL